MSTNNPRSTFWNLILPIRILWLSFFLLQLMMPIVDLTMNISANDLYLYYNNTITALKLLATLSVICVGSYLLASEMLLSCLAQFMPDIDTNCRTDQTNKYILISTESQSIFESWTLYTGKLVIFVFIYISLSFQFIFTICKIYFSIVKILLTQTVRLFNSAFKLT